MKITLTSFLLLSMALTIVGRGLSAPNVHGSAPKLASKTVDPFLIEMAGSGEGVEQNLFADESKRIAAMFQGSIRKNVALIDETGQNREFVIRGAAERLAAAKSGKKIVKVDWSSLLGQYANEDKNLRDIISLLESSKGQIILYIDDISGFSKDNPVLGASTAQELYKAITTGRIQVVSAATTQAFNSQIANDKLQERRRDGEGVAGERIGASAQPHGGR